MRAIDPQVHDAIFETIKHLLPKPDTSHPLGTHRRRVPDKLVFKGILLRLVTGASWTIIEYALDREVSDTTLRSRRDEWIKAGVFEKLCAQAQAGYDKIVGLELEHVALDGSNHKAPCGGQDTGYNPSDRGKQGWKWLISVDEAGIPLTWTTAGANRNDYALLRPALTQLQTAGYTKHIGTLHLDRGFGYKQVHKVTTSHGIKNLDVIPRRDRGQGPIKLVGLGKRWIVESANSWLSNYGQLRRSTDRKTIHRHAALQLAISILITSRLIDHRNKHQTRPIR